MAAMKLSGRDRAELRAILGVDPRKVDVVEEMIRLADRHRVREYADAEATRPAS